MAKILCTMKTYIQPFERILALRELKALCKSEITPLNNQEDEQTQFSIDTDLPLEYLLEYLTYWESLSKGLLENRLTRQVRRESTVNLARNGLKPEVFNNSLRFIGEVPLPNRRVLRYGSHGIHEYRGKFFPQLVRSLINITGKSENLLILDTMCGSGTTPVESILRRCRAVGMDFNPLSVFLSQAKCEILSVKPAELESEYELLKKDILKLGHKPNNDLLWFNQLPPNSRKYLVNWFSSEVLSEIDPITRRVNETKNKACRKLFLISLSNIIRQISWQKNDDLRVRKEIRLDIDIDVVSEFITEVTRSVKYVLAFLFENEGFEVGSARIVEGDARYADNTLKDMKEKGDAIITSPPYATALPYLDTDRLSLYYLNFFLRSDHRKHDIEMIGNREISNGLRKQYIDEYIKRKKELPEDIINTIDLIADLNEGTDAGFRRQNLPALLSKYFFDMKRVLETFLYFLKPNTPAYVVIGNNHTIAGGQRVDIETNKYLAQIGESVGLMVEDLISMEMLVSRDIFKKNTGTAETIICFRKN